MNEWFYYVPDFFRTARKKDGSCNIVTAKSINGNYIADPVIKQHCGFYAKDTGSATEELVRRDVSGVVQEYPNDWYEGITINFSKPSEWDVVSKSHGVMLHHPLGFDFIISVSDFNSLILTHKVNIIDGELLTKFKFVIWTGSNDIRLICEKQYNDEKYHLRTESSFKQLKQSTPILKLKDLKIGSVYQYFKNTNPICDSYQRVVYLGKIEHSKFLLAGDYYRDYRFVQDIPYHVFIVLVCGDMLGIFSDHTDCQNVHIDNHIARDIGPTSVCLMKSIVRRLRKLDPDQTLSIFENPDKIKYTLSLDQLVNGCKTKITAFENLPKVNVS